MNQKILLVCNDVIGDKMAGPAIRCIEIAKHLGRDYSVSVAAPSVQSYRCPNINLFEFSAAQFHVCAEEADIIIIQGDALRAHPFLKKCKAVLIADLYCPIPLEYHQVSDGLAIDVRTFTNAYLAEVLREQLAYADHFICASERQRNYWLGALTTAGRINALRWPNANHADVNELISLLPFGLADTTPVLERNALREMFSIPADDFVLVWGGGIYQWFDPLTVIRAVHRLTESGNKIHLAFIGVKHPNPGIEQHDMCARALALADELGLTGKYVHFNFGWTDYSARHNYLLDADIGVSAHYSNPETTFSFRTRMLDYLWCGLPIVATRGDVFGDALAKEQCGITVDYENVDEWVTALSRLINNPTEILKLREGSKIYSQQFRWDTLVSQLSDRLRKLSHSPDRDFIRKEFSTPQKISLFQRFKNAYSRGGILALINAIGRRLKIYA